MTSKEKEKYIYESPDGGKTVTRRKFGSMEKELLEEYNEIQSWKKDELEKERKDEDFVTLDLGTANLTTITTTNNTTDTMDVSGNYTYTAGSLSPSSLTLGGSGYTFEDVDPDIQVTVNGKERSMSKVIEQVDDISKRLKVLEKPDEKTLEKYKVLADIYEQYKVADAFLNSPGPEDEDEEH